MLELENLINDYLDYCRYRKNLNAKTVKAYRIDLEQFKTYIRQFNGNIDKKEISSYLTETIKTFKPRTAKRKTATLKAFFHYLEFEELIGHNPFNKIQTKFQEPQSLPKIIPIESISKIFNTVYQEVARQKTSPNTALRDAAILELLFATGMRVSEVCSIHTGDISWSDCSIKIRGKGSKERMMQLENKEVISTLSRYRNEFANQIAGCGFFFINRFGRRMSEQAVRFMINKYTSLAKISLHITPHMFRHSFATLLLDEDVDIRYIQKMLGHSSIATTQIYTHVSATKQRQILAAKHPRNQFSVES